MGQERIKIRVDQERMKMGPRVEGLLSVFIDFDVI